MTSRIGKTPVVLPKTGSSQAWFEVEDSPGLYVSAMQVLRSGGGFYIGRACLVPEGYEEPYSRESGYFPTAAHAAKALQEGFALRDAPEVNWLYGMDEGARSGPPVRVLNGEVQWPVRTPVPGPAHVPDAESGRVAHVQVLKFQAKRKTERTTSKSRAR